MLLGLLSYTMVQKEGIYYMSEQTKEITQKIYYDPISMAARTQQKEKTRHGTQKKYLAKGEDER